MQITNSVVCDTSKGGLYKQIIPLVGEHAFPLTGLVARQVTLRKEKDHIPAHTLKKKIYESEDCNQTGWRISRA